MVWYVPPLSPVLEFAAGPAGDGDPDDVFPAIDDLRIPISYPRQPARGRRRRAGTACAQAPGRHAPRHARAQLRRGARSAVAAEVGLSFAEIEEMYWLLALGKYDERYVILQAHAETGGDLYALQELRFDPPGAGLLLPPRSRRSTW